MEDIRWALQQIHPSRATGRRGPTHNPSLNLRPTSIGGWAVYPEKSLPLIYKKLEGCPLERTRCNLSEPKFNIGDARMSNQRVLDLTGGRVYARSSGGSGL